MSAAPISTALQHASWKSESIARYSTIGCPHNAACTTLNRAAGGGVKWTPVTHCSRSSFSNSNSCCSRSMFDLVVPFHTYVTKYLMHIIYQCSLHEHALLQDTKYSSILKPTHTCTSLSTYSHYHYTTIKICMHITYTTCNMHYI